MRKFDIHAPFRGALCHLVAVLLLAMLQACSGDKPKFAGIDLTDTKKDVQFTLSDVNGKERTLEDFRGSYVMLFYGFTQCPDVCPTTLGRAVEVRKKLGADAAKLRVVFVSVDPDRDTPELLRNYLQAFDPEFVGLRGTGEQTKVAAKALNVFFEKVPTGGSYTINHTALTYIFDPQGRLLVADRGNMRIQFLDLDGRYLGEWKQFSRPSGIAIRDGLIYVADSESNGVAPHPGWKRGIRIGNLADGKVLYRIPDPLEMKGTSAAEGVAVDARGTVYGGEVGPRQLARHVRNELAERQP